MAKFAPQFIGPVEGYAKNFIRSNLWKVKNTLDFDDCLQEAREQFFRTVQRMESNGDDIKNERHLMALFKTSWSRHFITLCNRSSKRPNEINESSFMSDDSSLGMEELLGEDFNMGYLACVLDQAPKEVKQVINLLLNAPSEILETAIATWSVNKKGAGSSNEFLCRMLGYNPKEVDLVEKMRDYLSD